MGLRPGSSAPGAFVRGVTGLLLVLLAACATKVSMYVLIRFDFFVFQGNLAGHAVQFAAYLMPLAILGILVGSSVAMFERNIKRMLAYSTISHVGFIFLGLLSGTDEGYGAAMFYAIVYALMAAGGFGVLTMISHKGLDAENIHDLKGLNDRSPWLAFMMMLVLFSMAGVPPTVGFFAKLFVLDAVISVDMVWLAIVAVFFSIIGAFYYLRAVKVMYFDKPIDDAPLVSSMDTQVIVSINGRVVSSE